MTDSSRANGRAGYLVLIVLRLTRTVRPLVYHLSSPISVLKRCGTAYLAFGDQSDAAVDTFSQTPCKSWGVAYNNSMANFGFTAAGMIVLYVMYLESILTD